LTTLLAAPTAAAMSFVVQANLIGSTVGRARAFS
jgi:hypothetical protein